MEAILKNNENEDRVIEFFATLCTQATSVETMGEGQLKVIQAPTPDDLTDIEAAGLRAVVLAAMISMDPGLSSQLDYVVGMLSKARGHNVAAGVVEAHPKKCVNWPHNHKANGCG